MNKYFKSRFWLLLFFLMKQNLPFPSFQPILTVLSTRNEQVSFFSGRPFLQLSLASTQKGLLSRLHTLQPCPSPQMPYLC